MACLGVVRGKIRYDVADWGHLGFIAGPPGSMKSTQLSYLGAAGICKKIVLGYDFDLGGRMIIWNDGEQPDNFVKAGEERLLKLGGCPEGSKQLLVKSYTHHITAKKKQEEMWETLFTYQDAMGLVVIDNVTNFLTNPNDIAETDQFLIRFIALAKHFKLLPLLVSHTTTPTDPKSKLFGMIGTTIEKVASWGFRTAQQGRYFGVKLGKARYAPPPPLWVTHDDINQILIPEPYFPF